MVNIPESIVNRVSDTYGEFFKKISKLPIEKIVNDVLDEQKVHDQISILCDAIGIAPNDLVGKKILEIGSGFGIFVSITRRDYKTETYGLEPGEQGFSSSLSISKDIVAFYGYDKNFIIDSKGEKIPFNNDYFDFIFSSTVIEHVDNPTQVFKESFRVLKPGGFIHFIYPNHHSFFDGHYAVFHPPLIFKGKLFPFIVKYLYRRDETFAHTLRTELNVISTKLILKKISRYFDFKLISLGEKVFLYRMKNFNFNGYAGVNKIKKIIVFLNWLKISNLIARICISLRLWDPIILTAQKIKEK